jgi:cytochrome P450
VPGAHAPFGYGSRMCIGWKFAVQEAKIALATLYRRLRFELEPGQVPLRTAVGITLSPRDGVWVRPVLRHGA